MIIRADKPLQYQLRFTIPVALIAIIVFGFVVVNGIKEDMRVSRLPYEDQKLNKLLRMLKQQPPFVKCAYLFDKNFYKETAAGVYDLRRNQLVGGKMLFENVPDLDYTNLHYKKMLNENESCWIFVFENGTRIYLDQRSLLIKRIEIKGDR